MSTTSASTAICAGKLRPPILSAMTTAAIPTSTSSRKHPRKKRFAKRQWRAVLSRRSAITAPRVSSIAEALKRSKSGRRFRSTINHQLSTSPPVALTIAGSDSSAGAGIQADLKTFSARGVYGVTAVTCIVAEIPGKVSRIERLSPAIVREQINVLASSLPIAAIKTGLLCSAEIIATVARALVDLAPNIPLIVDPVMVATTGDALLDPDATGIYEQALFPRATLITPNLEEAAKLLGGPIEDRQSMEGAACALADKYRTAVLLKGGHLVGRCQAVADKENAWR